MQRPKQTIVFWLRAVTTVLTLCYPIFSKATESLCSKALNVEDIYAEDSWQDNYRIFAAAYSPSAKDQFPQASLWDFDLIAFRGTFHGTNLPSEWGAALQPDRSWWPNAALTFTDRNTALQTRDDSLDSLYSEYETQGAEISDEIPAYRTEDYSRAQRTAQFILKSRGESIARMQAQYSKNAQEPVNLEGHLADASFFLRGNNPNLPVVEFGRLNIPRSKKINQIFNKKLLSTKDSRDLIGDLLWLQVLAHVRSLPPETIITFQTSQNVFKTLQAKFQPVQIQYKQSVRSPSEIISKLNHEDVEALIRLFTKRIIERLCARFIAMTPANPEMRLVFTIPPELVSNFEEFGLYEMADQQALESLVSQHAMRGFDPSDIRKLFSEFHESNTHQQASQLLRRGHHEIQITRSHAAHLMSQLSTP